MQDCEKIIIENEQLRTELDIQKREYLTIVNEKRDHAHITKPNASRDAGFADSSPSKFNGEGQESYQNQIDEIMELKNRAHLLTEENQVLFQQNSVLRSHYDQFNKNHAEKLEEANKKIQLYSKLDQELQGCISQRDNYMKTCKFLENKLSH